MRQHDQNKYPRQGNMSSGKFPKKKFVFWGFFEFKTAQTCIAQTIRNLEEIIKYKIYFFFFFSKINYLLFS